MSLRKASFAVFLTLALCAVLPLLDGCNQGGSTSPGGDSLTVQDSIHQFLPQALIDTLKKYGMIFNDGDTPPNIEGMYYANMQRRKNSNVPGDGSYSFANMSLRFSHQMGQRVDVEYNQSDIEVGGGTGAFLTGSDSVFTIYVPVKGVYRARGDSVIYQSATCYSGRVTSAGIVEFLNANLITTKSADSGNIILNVGQGRVVAESDSLAERVTDYPHVP